MNEISISLTPENWNKVLAALAERPFKEAAPLIGEIQRKVQAQIAEETEDDKVRRMAPGSG